MEEIQRYFGKVVKEIYMERTFGISAIEQMLQAVQEHPQDLQEIYKQITRFFENYQLYAEKEKDKWKISQESNTSRIEYVSLLFIECLIFNIFQKVDQIEQLKSNLSRISASESNSGIYSKFQESRFFDKSKEFLIKFIGRNSGLSEFLNKIGDRNDYVQLNEVMKSFKKTLENAAERVQLDNQVYENIQIVISSNINKSLLPSEPPKYMAVVNQTLADMHKLSRLAKSAKTAKIAFSLIRILSQQPKEIQTAGEQIETIIQQGGRNFLALLQRYGYGSSFVEMQIEVKQRLKAFTAFKDIKLEEEENNCLLCDQQISHRTNESITKKELKTAKLHKKCLLNYEVSQFCNSLKGTITLSYISKILKNFPEGSISILGKLYSLLQSQEKHTFQDILTFFFDDFLFPGDRFTPEAQLIKVP